MKLIVYTKRGCPWCEEVLSFLRGEKISFEEREVRANAGYFQELETKSHQNKTPTFDIDGEIFADSSKAEIIPVLIQKGILVK
jgi:glutaredoxin 3